MLRLFLGLPIPDDVAVRCLAAQTGIEGAKWSPRDNFHITLRFIGEVDERQAEDIDAAVGALNSPGFDMELDGVDWFGGAQPKAAFAKVKASDALMQLQRLVEKACRGSGLAADSRAYLSHVTLCYFTPNQALQPVMDWVQGHNLLQAGPFWADRFYLYSSRTGGPGPSRFRHEAEYPLVGR